jgi:hypothetical protein
MLCPSVFYLSHVTHWNLYGNRECNAYGLNNIHAVQQKSAYVAWHCWDQGLKWNWFSGSRGNSPTRRMWHKKFNFIKYIGSNSCSPRLSLRVLLISLSKANLTSVLQNIRLTCALVWTWMGGDNVRTDGTREMRFLRALAGCPVVNVMTASEDNWGKRRCQHILKVWN